ncbi:MAG TPA: ABC transporter ATP-binding protein [Candidatus Saccharimonadales bacterium]|nr:ABC transporter ATP-binding protein [Candidatus Saccharimonadales bacterium]HSX27506.1 ABC transporter ATP-binding protein [Patescibacteria group bacterium]
MSKSIVKVDDLHKSYNGKEVVKGISFEVKAGETFGILGPNGAGKTTTLEMIETLRPIDKGIVTIDGVNVSENPQKIKYMIGVQTQSTAFMDKVKLTELLEQQAAAYGEHIDPLKLLRDVNLESQAGNYIENLSGGQKQRFSIAAALVHSPKVFFLDEPTTGLDPQARRRLWELIQTVKAKGVTVILTTHYMEEAEMLCERVAIMDEGTIVAMDSPKNLIRQLLAKGFKKERRVEQADLEDVFIDLTGKELRG